MKHLLFIITVSSLTLLSSCTRLIETEDRRKEICENFTINNNGELDYPNKRPSLFTDRSSVQFRHWADKTMYFDYNNEEVVFSQMQQQFDNAEPHKILGDSKMGSVTFKNKDPYNNITIDLDQYYYCYEEVMEIDGYINGDRFGFYKEGYTRFKSTDDTKIERERHYQNQYLKGYSHNLKEYNKDKKSPTSRRYRGGRFALYLYPKNAKNLEYVVWDPELGIVEFKLYDKQAPFYRIFDIPTGI